jgi:putative ABC transport system permease protein
MPDEIRDWTAAVRERLAREADAPRLTGDVIEEIGQHIADAHRGALFQGRSVDEANALAEAELDRIRTLAAVIARRDGGAKARARTEIPTNSDAGRRAPLLAGVWRDVTHAWRLLSAKRGYATLMVATLAVGIGACTAVFGLFNSLLLGPLPYPNPERLVLVWETDADDRSASFIVAAPNYLDWIAGTRSFSALGIWEHQTFNVSATAEPEQVQGIRASSSLFQVLGVNPAHGRLFSAAEDAPGHRVAVIADAVWKVHFAADPSAIGRQLRLNGSLYEVIGVMPPGFEFPRKGTGVWVPIAFTEQDQERGAHSFYVAGRLAENVTFEQARDEVERLGRTLSAQHEANRGEGATVERMQDFGVVNTRRILIALSGAVVLVLLMACVNVASLQLALGLARRREFVTRLSLGARYSQLARQVFVEGLLIAALGCAGGIAVAVVITRSVDFILSPGFRNLPFRGETALTLDLRVLIFAIVVSGLSALLFAFAPLVGLRRRALQAMLREGDRGATRLASGTRRALVTAEIALALIVLCGAGLMIRSLATLLRVEPGLDPRNVLVMQVSLPQGDTYGAPERAGFCADLAREVGSVPGVLHASAISHLPLSGANAGRAFTIEGRPQPAPNDGASGNYRVICPDYFAALSIPVLAGREFSAHDVRNGDPVVVVNREAAQRYWPGADPVGQRLKIGGFDSENPWLTIVAVVENVRHFGLEAAPRREIFRPYTQAAWPVMTVLAKTAGEPMNWQRPVRDALKRVELNLPAANARSMEQVVGQSIAWRATPMRLLTGFALVGLLLAGIGVYGVLAYYVSQRTRELGVRVALGASKRALIGLVLRQSAVPLVLGIALGIAGSIASGRLLAELLYEVKPGDPTVMITIVALLTLVALASSWLPARRAARVDPLVALREE